MGETNPSVSVIICAYSLERLNDVREAVDSILSQTMPARQLIVSVDHNPELLNKLRETLPSPVTFTSNSGIKGLSETRNTGIRIATGDIIAFMDDDAVAEKDWLANLTEPFRNDEVAAAGGRIVPRWEEDRRPGWFPDELYWIVGCTYTGMSLNGNRMRNVIGCNMAFRAVIFNSIGLFDTALGRTSKNNGIGEDSEICLRLSRKQPESHIVYRPEAVVHHKVPAWRTEPGYIMRRSFDEGYHKSTVKRLHSGNSGTLTAENSYLRFLLFDAVPRRLLRIYRRDSFLQLDAILTCITATGAGYLQGQLRR